MLRQRSFLTEENSQQVFKDLHGMSHPGVKAFLRLIRTRYFLPNFVKDFVHELNPVIKVMPKFKIHRHVKQPIIPLEAPSQQFETFHIDIVGPLPPITPTIESLAIFRYLCFCIDRNTR